MTNTRTLLFTLSTAALLAFMPAAHATPDAEAVQQTKPAVEETVEETGITVEEAEQNATQPVEEVSAGEDMPVEEVADDAAPATPTDEAEVTVIEDAVEGEDEGEAEEAHDSGHETIHYPQVDWSFEGPFGTFDRAALQRGFQVYKQVCAACHGLTRVAYRNLAALGYNEDEIKSIAAEASIVDGPNDEGEMFERPGRPSDRFKAPFANDNAARYANNGALPPDLSLITRARSDGSNYVHALLTGYTEAPAGITVAEGMHYNKYFSGHQIAMAQPLSDGVVSYEDGTDATVEQMSKDVATFLTWAGEPVMEKRKQVGLKALIFLLVFSVLMYMTKRKIWKDIH